MQKKKKKQEKIGDKLLEYELEKINGLISRINGKEIDLELDRKMGRYISFIKQKYKIKIKNDKDEFKHRMRGIIND